MKQDDLFLREQELHLLQNKLLSGLALSKLLNVSSLLSGNLNHLYVMLEIDWQERD